MKINHQVCLEKLNVSISQFNQNIHFSRTDLGNQFLLALESISAYLFMTFSEDKLCLFQIDRALFLSFWKWAHKESS